MIARSQAGPVLYLGDVYDSGTAEEFDSNYRPAYGRFDKITAPTPGNHDWPQHEEGYDPYWRRRTRGCRRTATGTASRSPAGRS